MYLRRNFIAIRNTLVVLSIALCYICCYYPETRKSENAWLLPIPEECVCRDNATGIDYDFCYQLDTTAFHNRASGNGNVSTNGSEANVRGQRFDCQWLSMAQRLGLLDEDGFVDLEHGDALPPAVFVSGVSSNHYKEEENLIYLVQKYFPHQKLVLYDLGLSDDKVRTVKSYCNVEYRKFHFESFPGYVSKLIQYRWKPLIIAEALQEFKVIWWLDSSVVWNKSDLSHVYDLVQCQQTLGGKMKTIHRLERKSGRLAKVIESGFDKNQWRAAMLRCDKFPYLLHSFTGHGIFPATNKDVYKYLPVDLDRLKNPQAMMFDAGFAFAVRTKEVMQRVVKWYSLCALEEHCMAPPGSSLSCSFKANKFTDHAGCHRFDQSVVNVLLANANAYDRYYWTSGMTDFFKIVRGGGPPTAPRQCAVSQTPSSYNRHVDAKQP